LELKILRGELQLKTGTEILKVPLIFTFLAAPESGKPFRESVYTDKITLKGAGSDGKEDETTVKFSRDQKGLHLRIESKDDEFHQTLADGNIWRQDSLQIAFDTDPKNEFEYDELTSRTSKKVTSLGFALTPKGPYAHRYQTFNERILKTGDVSKDIPFTAVRKNGVTVYDITIPWSQIGMNGSEAVSGKKLGFSLLVNDCDGGKTTRRTIPLFGGIYDNSGWRNYGVLNLK